MKRTWWAVALALGMCLLVGTAQAQQAEGEREGVERWQQVDVQHFLNRFDRNDDKAISKDELPARLQDNFSKIDRNRDGKLDATELRAHALRMNAAADQCQACYVMIYRAQVDPVTLKDLQHSYQLMRSIDEDNDGKITAEEIRTAQKKVREHHARSIFQDWDRNKDGRLSKDEVSRFLAAHFDHIDRNKDGHIDREEMQQAFVARETPGEEEAGERDKSPAPPRDRR